MARPLLTIDSAALLANWRRLSQAAAPGLAAATLKADAYGLGADRIAPLLVAAGARHLFTATLQEAALLRPLVPPGVEIAVLNGLAGAAPAAFLALNLMPVLNRIEDVARWSGAGPAWIQLDLGMERLGVSAAEVSQLPRDLPWLRGLLGHLSHAGQPDCAQTRASVALWQQMRVLRPGVPGSLSNSCGLFDPLVPRCDLARPGAALHGFQPVKGETVMQPVVRLEAPLLQIRQIPAGRAIGYDGTWVAARPSRIGILGIGYADWRLVTGQPVLAAGQEVPVIGRVSMDLTAVDLTDLAQEPPAWLTLLGEGLSLERLTAVTGSVGYEILTRLGSRIERRLV